MLLFSVWNALKHINCVTFQFKSADGKHGYGLGDVVVQDKPDCQLIFNEKGSWRGLANQEFAFRNVLRWKLNQFDGMLTLEHLRFGVNNPVFLFHLVPTGPNHLKSACPYLCGPDTYLGQLEFKSEAIELVCHILGPKKNEEVKFIWDRLSYYKTDKKCNL